MGVAECKYVIFSGEAHHRCITGGRLFPVFQLGVQDWQVLNGGAQLILNQTARAYSTIPSI
jgi:hypothetical protein